MSESRTVQNMLRGGDVMRGASRKFEPGVTSAPEADTARERMRTEELRRLEGRPLTKEEFIRQSNSSNKPDLLNYTGSLSLENNPSTQETDFVGVGSYLADEFDRASVKLTDRDRRRASNIDKESRILGFGERPPQKPKHKTEPTHFRTE